MKNKLLEDIRKYHECLKDKNGKWRDIPTGIISRCSTSEKNIERLKTVLTTILSSDGISEETKLFITDPDISMRAVNAEINRMRSVAQTQARKRIAPLSYNNTIKKISDDNSRIHDVLNLEFIRNIVYNRVRDDDVEVDDKIEKFVIIFGTCDKSRNNLAIKINDDVLKKNSYCNNEEFFAILESLESYLKVRMGIIEKAINTNVEFVEYFNYLLNSSAIHDKECHNDRERLLRFLHNEDYSMRDNGSSDSDGVIGTIGEEDMEEDDSFEDTSDETEKDIEESVDSISDEIDEDEDDITI